jgi:hypothetical protein
MARGWSEELVQGRSAMSSRWCWLWGSEGRGAPRPRLVRVRVHVVRNEQTGVHAHSSTACSIYSIHRPAERLLTGHGWERRGRMSLLFPLGGTMAALNKDECILHCKSKWVLYRDLAGDLCMCVCQSLTVSYGISFCGEAGIQ